MTATPALARFGHDPSPARDFVLQVNALRDRLFRVINGMTPAGADGPETLREVSAAIDQALTFKVGGDTEAVLAKQVLRELRVQADLARARHAAASGATAPADVSAVDIDELAQEIRRVDGAHSLGAGLLAEALAPYIAHQIAMHVAAAREAASEAPALPPEDITDTAAIRICENGTILAGNSVIGDHVAPEWTRRVVACVNHFAGMPTDAVEKLTLLNRAPETKTLRDALHRAIAATRGHKDAMFKSDGDVIEQFMQHGVPCPPEWVLVPHEATPEMHAAHRMYCDTSDWWNAVVAASPLEQRPAGEDTGQSA